MTERADIHFVPEQHPFAESSARLHKTRATVARDGRERTIPLVTKKFKDEAVAALAVETYKKLRTIGLKLLPHTYRRNMKDPLSVHMTDFDRDTFVTIATNTIRPIGGKIESIHMPSLSKVLKSLEHDVRLLSSHHVKMPSIAYFASLQKGGGHDVVVNVAIGDLDYFIEFDSKDSERDCLRHNLKEVEHFLYSCVCRRIHNPDEQARVRRIIDTWHDKLASTTE